MTISDLGFCLCSVRGVAVDQLIEEDAQGPNIDRAIVRFVSDHFRRHVLECAAKSVPLRFIHFTFVVRLDFTLASPSEITNFNHVLTVYKQVLRLQVTVDEPLLVHEVDASDSLDKEPEGLRLRHSLVLGNPAEKIILGDELHDEVDEFTIVEVSVESHDVVMLEFLMDLNFSLQRH